MTVCSKSLRSHQAIVPVISDPVEAVRSPRFRREGADSQMRRGGDDLDAMYAPECGGSVKEYFWLNSLHPTQTAHRFTAAVIAEDCFGPGGPRRYCS